MLNWNVKKSSESNRRGDLAVYCGTRLLGFAAGILVTQYFPGVAALVVFPALAIGVVLLRLLLEVYGGKRRLTTENSSNKKFFFLLLARLVAAAPACGATAEDRAPL